MNLGCGSRFACANAGSSAVVESPQEQCGLSFVAIERAQSHVWGWCRLQSRRRSCQSGSESMDSEHENRSSSKPSGRVWRHQGCYLLASVINPRWTWPMIVQIDVICATEKTISTAATRSKKPHLSMSELCENFHRCSQRIIPKPTMTDIVGTCVRSSAVRVIRGPGGPMHTAIPRRPTPIADNSGAAWFADLSHFKIPTNRTAPQAKSRCGAGGYWPLACTLF